MSSNPQGNIDLENPNKLQLIMELQNALNAKVSLTAERAAGLSITERTEWVERFLKACHNEMEEIRGELPWKWWKPTELQRQDLEKAREEWIDLFHFVISLGIALGFPTDGDAIVQAYLKKNAVNHQRQVDWKATVAAQQQQQPAPSA